MFACLSQSKRRERLRAVVKNMLLSPESSYNERKAGQVAELLPAVASGGVW